MNFDCENFSDAKTVWVEISINDKVKDLKRIVSIKTGIEVEHQKLIFDGEELKDDTRMCDCSTFSSRHETAKRMF